MKRANEVSKRMELLNKELEKRVEKVELEGKTMSTKLEESESLRKKAEEINATLQALIQEH